MTEPLVLSGQAGTITVAAVALDRVVVQAAESVEGARVRRPKRSVDVAHRAGLASVSFELAIEQGVPVPELSDEERAAREAARRRREERRRKQGRGHGRRT